MGGKKLGISAGAIFLCAIMVLVACAPLTSAQDEHLIVKGVGGPNASAVTWEYRTGADEGQWVGHIVNNGLRSLVIDVVDVTSGTPTDLLHQRIRFSAYPTDIVDTSPVLMGANRIFSITATPNGPKGTTAMITDVFTALPKIVAAFSIVSNIEGIVSVDASASTGAIVKYDWDWGDGAFGTGMTATHIYDEDGTYEITLTVIDYLGLRDSCSQFVLIDITLPHVIMFTVTINFLTVTVDASGSSDPDGTIVSYAWDWGDGAYGTGMMATHTYSEAGTYTITLTVTYNDGSTASESKSVTVISPMTPQVTYTISNMFESYKKYDMIPFDYSKLGRWTTTSGLNSWYPLRQAGYGEWTVRGTYPFIIASAPYSPNTSPVAQAGNVLQSFYRLTIEAKNMPELGTDNDPIFIPILSGNAALPGGNVSVNWYGTYLCTQELVDMRTSPGKHYANTYYGVPYNYFGIMDLPRMDDGYWQELQATMSFDRAAAVKFLNLSGTGVLKDEFAAAKQSIDRAWLDDWMTEGSGIYDIYTAYDYSDDIRILYVTLDPTGNTNPEQLDLRFWSLSWGNEILMTRYLEASSINQWMQGWMEEFYLNLTMGPSRGDAHLRAVHAFYISATQDQSAKTKPAWMLESMSIDNAGNWGWHILYNSPYNIYDPDQYPTTTRQYWNPGSTTFGQRANVYSTPLHWNLLAGESLIVKLPTGIAGGIIPYIGTSDILSTVKMAEYNSYYVDGEASLGTGYPTNLNDYYDSATKTLTLIGPWSAPRNVNPSNSLALETGCPCILIDIG